MAADYFKGEGEITFIDWLFRLRTTFRCTGKMMFPIRLLMISCTTAIKPQALWLYRNSQIRACIRNIFFQSILNTVSV
jgi:hypothetical protein